MRHAPSFVVEQKRLDRELDLRADIIGLGVDRLDYTKGIPERLDALDRAVHAAAGAAAGG